MYLPQQLQLLPRLFRLRRRLVRASTCIGILLL